MRLLRHGCQVLKGLAAPDRAAAACTLYGWRLVLFLVRLHRLVKRSSLGVCGQVLQRCGARWGEAAAHGCDLKLPLALLQKLPCLRRFACAQSSSGAPCALSGPCGRAAVHHKRRQWSGSAAPNVKYQITRSCCTCGSSGASGRASPRGVSTMSNLRNFLGRRVDRPCVQIPHAVCQPVRVLSLALLC